MRVVSTFHPSSAVVDSLKCCLASDETEHLVIANSDRLEVYSVLPEGLVRLCQLGIFGRVISIAAIARNSSQLNGQSNLLVLLDHPQPELLLIVLENDALRVKRSLSLVEQGRPAEFLTKVIVNKPCTLALVSCYVGKLKVVRIKDGDFNVAEAPPLNIPELSLLDIIFLPAVSSTAFALLHFNFKKEIQLLCREISIEDGPIPELSSPLDALPKTVVPNKSLFVPTAETLPRLIAVGDEASGESECGVLVMGGRKLLLYTLADEGEQTKLRNKRNRLEKRKKSKNQQEIEEAKKKELERENRKRKAKYDVMWPWGEVNAICTLNLGVRWLLGDAFGRLSILSAEVLGKQGLLLVPIGEASPPSSLTYLTRQHVFIGSFRGDSLLAKISPHPLTQLTSPTLYIPDDIRTITPGELSATSSDKGKQRAVEEGEEKSPSGYIVKTMGSFLEVVQSFKNIGPILDAVLVSDTPGEAQIVTCSGGANRGSLNILRSGADFRQLATIEDLPPVTTIWPLRRNFEDGTHTHVALSTTQQTYVIRLDSESSASVIKPASSRGIITSQPSLAVANVCRKYNGTYDDGTYIVQVTPSCVRLLAYELALGDYDQVGNDWIPPKGARIVSASVHACLIAIGVTHSDKHELLVFRMIDITDEKDDIFEILGRTKTPNEISAISCIPIDRNAKTSHIITVAYWEINRVEIFRFQRPLEQLLSHCTLPDGVHLPSLPTSVLLFNFGSSNRSGDGDYRPLLVIGLADGSIATLAYSTDNVVGTLTDYKVVTNLGPSPVSLKSSIINGRNTVFAAGSRGALLSWHNQRLRTSSILLKNVMSAACLNTAEYPSAFMLSTPSCLFIGNVPDLDQMHIRTIELGYDNPRRIAYDAQTNVFGVAVNRAAPTLIGDPEPVYDNRFWILDGATFEKRAEYFLPKDEVIASLTSLEIGSRRFFCLGTYLFNSNEAEPTSGRIIILEYSPPDSENINAGPLVLKQVTEIQTPGVVYGLSVIDSNLLAAIVNSAVIVYSPEETTAEEANTTMMLYKLAEKNQHYIATSLDVFGQTLIVGDALGSVSYWSLKREEQEKTSNVVKTETPQPKKVELVSVVKDYRTVSPTALALNKGGVLGGDLQTNLFSFTPVEKQVGSQKQTVFERNGFFYLGDMVNKFIRGSVAPKESVEDQFEGENIFFTSSGRIGVIINVKDQNLGLNLTGIERNLRYVIGNAGGSSHAKFRAPYSNANQPTEGAVGFLDGDFLERTLTLGTADLDKVMAGKNQAEKLKMPLNAIQEVLEKLQALH